MFGKKSSEKSAKNVCYIHTNVVTKKWGEKTRVTIFQIQKNSAIKKCEKNRRKKVRKRFFYIHTNIVTKKWVNKTRETIFPENN